VIRRYIIIGTGPAGIAAAGAVNNRDPAAQLLLIGDDPFYFYSRPGLAYFMTSEIEKSELILSQANQFQHIKALAIGIDPVAHKVILADGRYYVYDRLLLATGSMAMKLSVNGENLRGVFKLDDMVDAQKIVRLASQSKSAVVTGGGITALEIVEMLVAHGVKTHYVLRGERYWHNVLDKVESAIVEQRLVKDGVVLHLKSQLKQIIGRNGKVSGVETERGLIIKCQMVGVAVGVQPRLELALSCGINTKRGILTDAYLQTSAPDIFAAGDVAEVFDPLAGKSVVEMLWGKALAQGWLAGSNMAGANLTYTKSVPFNVTRLAGLTTTIIGTVGTSEENDNVLIISRGESETWRYPPNVIAVQRDFDINRTRILVNARNIIGAVVMGDQTLSRPLHQLIAQRVDISAIHDQLLAPGSPLVDVIIKFWSNWRSYYATQ